MPLPRAKAYIAPSPTAAGWRRSASWREVSTKTVPALSVETALDDPRPPATIRPTLHAGPRRDRRTPLLEVMVETTLPHDVHAA